jgi:pyruvate/2-oxoglutarate/acetoin dehydrogenase E1 component
VIDTPLNESGIVGTSIGMAIAGARPVAEIQFDGFVYPAFDQIVSHLGTDPVPDPGPRPRCRWW